MKTTILLAALLFSMTTFASGNQGNAGVQKAMKTYVNTLIEQNGFMPVLYKGKIHKLKLKKSKKYPDGFHAGVANVGDLFASCADFVDASGKVYDIDFLVSKASRGFEVIQPVVHSIAGKKNPYDLNH
jgi:hypothetical protein